MIRHRVAYLLVFLLVSAAHDDAWALATFSTADDALTEQNNDYPTAAGRPNRAVQGQPQPAPSPAPLRPCAVRVPRVPVRAVLPYGPDLLHLHSSLQR